MVEEIDLNLSEQGKLQMPDTDVPALVEVNGQLAALLETLEGDGA